MKENNSKAETRRILIYVITTFVLTWAYCLTLVYPMMNGETLSGVPAIATQLLVAAAMFFPAAAALKAWRSPTASLPCPKAPSSSARPSGTSPCPKDW